MTKSIGIATMVLAGWILATMLPMSTSAQDNNALTNDDVMKMARAGLSSNVIVTTIKSAPRVKFDLSTGSLAALTQAGISDSTVEAMIVKARPVSQIPQVTQIDGPEKSTMLNSTKSNETILRSFKTLAVQAWDAGPVDDKQIKAALIENKIFKDQNIVIVDDPKVADAILKVSYVFAWDYPFTLTYNNSSVVLLSGKGTGPFSAPAGAKSVADNLVKALKPYREAPSKPKAK